jgi:hypothetical protein
VNWLQIEKGIAFGQEMLLQDNLECMNKSESMAYRPGE